MYLGQIKSDFQNLKTDKISQDNRQRDPKKKKNPVPYQRGENGPEPNSKNLKINYLSQISGDFENLKIYKISLKHCTPIPIVKILFKKFRAVQEEVRPYPILYGPECF